MTVTEVSVTFVQTTVIWQNHYFYSSIQIPMKLRSRCAVTWGVTGVQEQTEGHQRAEQRQGAHDSSSAVRCSRCSGNDGGVWSVLCVGRMTGQVRGLRSGVAIQINEALSSSGRQHSVLTRTNKQTNPLLRTSFRASHVVASVRDPTGDSRIRSSRRINITRWRTDTNISEEQPSPFP